MTSLVSNPRLTLPGIAAWLENPWPFGEHNPMRIEESRTAGRYTVRAELPGFDADKHISVTTRGGLLTIAAEREAPETDDGHSEFRYGSFSRTTSLPAGADASKMSARYTDGILEVSMPHTEQPSDQQLKIQVAKS